MNFMTLAKVNEAAREMGLSYGQYVSRYRLNEGPRRKTATHSDNRSKIDYDDLVRLYIAGMSMQQIADGLGVSESAVRKYIKRMRITR